LKKHDRRMLTAGVLTALLTAVAPAQDPQGPPPPVPPVPVGAVDPEAGRKEMIELFLRVEQRLREIDQLLFDASAGDVIGEDVEEAGIADLLRQSTSKAKEVVEGIDRILEIAEQQGSAQQTMQSSGQGQQQGSQGSPLDRQQQGEQGQKEPTPEAPGDREQPPEQGQGNKPEQEQRGKDGQPKSPSESDEEANNEENRPPSEGETGSGTRTVDTTERWGDLPIHVRDLFRSEGGGDMPPQYRDWIDAYYRRLNQRP